MLPGRSLFRIVHTPATPPIPDPATKVPGQAAEGGLKESEAKGLEASSLRSKRLLLRPVVREDADQFAFLLRNPEMWEAGRGALITRDQAQSRAEQAIGDYVCHYQVHGFGPFAVTLARSPRGLLGIVGLRHFPPQVDRPSRPGESPTAEADLIFTLGRPYWRRGIATEAAMAALRYGFTILGFSRISSFALPHHAASFRVMEKLGMQPDGQWRAFDQTVHAMTVCRDDWLIQNP